MPVRCEESWQSFSSVQGQAMPRFSKWDCKFAFDQGGRSSFFHCEHYPANGPDEVEQYGWIDNRDYRAQLTKRGQNKSWQLSELILGTDTAIHKKMGYRMACPWLRCGNIWLPEWIADASFVVTRTEEVLEAGAAKALRVHFAYDASQRQSQADDVPDYVQSGFIDFDPLCRWRVMRY
ncbi:MAG: hypothetical protein HY040_14395 [Planctomycetes bacterium]|nr:hypothetical protein [Planctomycetota bacterium]